MIKISENDLRTWDFKVVENVDDTGSKVYPNYGKYLILLGHSAYVGIWMVNSNVTTKHGWHYPIVQGNDRKDISNVMIDLNDYIMNKDWKGLANKINKISVSSFICTKLTPDLNTDLQDFVSQMPANIQAGTPVVLRLSDMLKHVKPGQFIKCTKAISMEFSIGKVYEVFLNPQNMKIGITADHGGFISGGGSTFKAVSLVQGHSHNHTSSQPAVTASPTLSSKDPYAKDDDAFEITEWKPEEEQVDEYDSWGIGKSYEYKKPKKEYEGDNPEDTKFLNSNKRICDW